MGSSELNSRMLCWAWVENHCQQRGQDALCLKFYPALKIGLMVFPHREFRVVLRVLFNLTYIKLCLYAW